MKKANLTKRDKEEIIYSDYLGDFHYLHLTLVKRRDAFYICGQGGALSKSGGSVCYRLEDGYDVYAVKLAIYNEFIRLKWFNRPLTPFTSVEICETYVNPHGAAGYRDREKIYKSIGENRSILDLFTLDDFLNKYFDVFARKEIRLANKDDAYIEKAFACSDTDVIMTSANQFVNKQEWTDTPDEIYKELSFPLYARKLLTENAAKEIREFGLLLEQFVTETKELAERNDISFKELAERNDISFKELAERNDNSFGDFWKRFAEIEDYWSRHDNAAAFYSRYNDNWSGDYKDMKKVKKGDEYWLEVKPL